VEGPSEGAGVEGHAGAKRCEARGGVGGRYGTTGTTSSSDAARLRGVDAAEDDGVDEMSKC